MTVFGETSKTLMKAVVCTRYGPPDVLELREVERPIPKDDEILVRVHATTASRGDCELRSLKLPVPLQIPVRIGFGFRGPRRKILGQELAGEVDLVGKGVTRFKKGDRVFAFTGFRLGAYAEYDCLPQKGLVAAMPPNMSYEEAAAVPVGGLHALHFLGRADIQPGRKVLIVGAGGSIGTFAVQIAKSSGAGAAGQGVIDLEEGWQEGGRWEGVIQGRGPGRVEGADQGREGKVGDRQVLPAGTNRRSA